MEGDMMITCNFCGHSFNETDSISACKGCPMSKSCNKHKCPNCGFEVPQEPGIIKLLRKWGQKYA